MPNLDTYLTSLGLKRNNGIRKSHHIIDEVAPTNHVPNVELLVDYAERGDGPNVYDYFLKKQAELNVTPYPLPYSYLSNLKLNNFNRFRDVLRFNDSESLGIVFHISYHIMKILTASVYEINDRTEKTERMRLLSEIQRRCLKEFQDQSTKEAKSFGGLKDNLKVRPYGNFAFENEDDYIKIFDELVSSVISYSNHVHFHLVRGYSDSAFKERMTALKERINVLMRPKSSVLGYVDAEKQVPIFYDLINRPLSGRHNHMRTWEDRSFAAALASPSKTNLPLLSLDHFYYRKSGFILCAMDIDTLISKKDYQTIKNTFPDNVCYKSFSGSPKVFFKIDVTNANVKEAGHYRYLAIDVIKEMVAKLDGKLEDTDNLIDSIDFSYSGLFRAFLTPDFMSEVDKLSTMEAIVPEPIPDEIKIDYSLNPLSSIQASEDVLAELGFPKATGKFKDFIGILLASLSLATDKGFCISQKKIAFQIGTDQGTISRYIKILKEYGLLDVIDNDYVVGKLPKRYRAIGALDTVLSRSIDTVEEKIDIKYTLDEKLAKVEPGTWHQLIWELSGIYKTEREFLKNFFMSASDEVKKSFMARRDRQKKVARAYRSRMRYDMGFHLDNGLHKGSG